MPLNFDKALLGSEFDHTDFPPITPERIREYALASGETNPRYTTADAAALVAPATFVVSLRSQKFMPANLPAALGLGRNGFDAGKDIDFGVAVRPGDVLSSTSTVHDIFEKTGRTGSMVFVVLRTVMTNSRGETVATIDQKMMFR